mgnify:CR=1 FL=1
MITLHELQQDWNEFICSGIEMECNTRKFDPNKLRDIQNKLNEKIELYIEESVEMESDKEDAYKSQH